MTETIIRIGEKFKPWNPHI